MGSKGVHATLYEAADLRGQQIPGFALQKKCQVAFGTWSSQEETLGDLGQALMLENIRVFIAEQIKPPARRQEAEAGLGQVKPAFALQQAFKLGPERMEMQHV